MNVITSGLGISPKEFESQMLGVLRQLLMKIEWLTHYTVEAEPEPIKSGFDYAVRMELPHKGLFTLRIRLEMYPRPSRVPAVMAAQPEAHEKGQGAFLHVLAAPYIHSRMADVCKSHHWGWVDLSGNSDLEFAGLFCLKCEGRAPLYKLPAPITKMDSPETMRIFRLLLSPENLAKHWSQRQIEKRCQPKVSLGLVNKVVCHLREEDYLHETGLGVRLKDPAGLLKAWKEAYSPAPYKRAGYFTLLTGNDLDDRLSRLEGATGRMAAYCSFSAAQKFDPDVRQPLTWVYLSQECEEKLCALLEAHPVESGANVIVIIPNDEGVFHHAPKVEAGGLRCTNAVQTYLDLVSAGGRGPEAAEVLLERIIKPAWFQNGYSAVDPKEKSGSGSGTQSEACEPGLIL